MEDYICFLNPWYDTQYSFKRNVTKVKLFSFLGGQLNTTVSGNVMLAGSRCNVKRKLLFKVKYFTVIRTPAYKD